MMEHAKARWSGVRLILRDRRKSGLRASVTKTIRQLLAMPDAENANLPIPRPRLRRADGGSAVEILDRGLMIGRDRDSDLVVPGAQVSRRHGIVRHGAHGYVLTDVSKNGIYVNGRRVDGARVLRIGDVVQIGEEEFRFEAGRATGDPAATLPRRLVQRLAQLPTAARQVGISRHLATLRRLHTKPSITTSRLAQFVYLRISGLLRAARSHPNPDKAQTQRSPTLTSSG
jgi:pSer/pThr/pTyr-binding forkhead associated (FHA) protein